MLIVGLIDETEVKEIDYIYKLTVVVNRIHQLSGVD